MRREPREVWATRVARLRESDLTAKEFAAEIGVNWQTLLHWKYLFTKEQREAAAASGLREPREKPPRLGQQSKPTVSGQRPRRTKRKAPAVTFIEVPAAVAAPSPQIEIELRSGTLLRFPPDLDTQHLGKLLDVLEARR